MAVCLRSRISFPLILMTEMWGFVMFHWRTATFLELQNCCHLGKTKNVMVVDWVFSSFFIIFVFGWFFCLFNWKGNFFGIFSPVLSSGEISPVPWEPPVESCVRFSMPLVHLDFKALSEMNWKCPDCCYKSGSFLVQSRVMLHVDWVGRTISHQSLTGKVLAYIFKYCILLANTVFREVCNQAFCLLFC